MDPASQTADRDLDQALGALIRAFAKKVPLHPWVDEHQRWLELVTCLLFVLSGDAAEQAREVTGVLDALRLLDVAELAGTPLIDGKPDPNDEHLRWLRSVIERFGASPEDSRLAAQSLTSCARDLRARSEGRPQVYLRRQGERILAELREDFPSLVSHDDRAHVAMRMWLQNALAMPVFLDCGAAVRFCEGAGCTLNELHAAADRLGINAAAVDDVLEIWSTLEMDVCAVDEEGSDDA